MATPTIAVAFRNLADSLERASDDQARLEIWDSFISRHRDLLDERGDAAAVMLARRDLEGLGDLVSVYSRQRAAAHVAAIQALGPAFDDEPVALA